MVNKTKKQGLGYVQCKSARKGKESYGKKEGTAQRKKETLALSERQQGRRESSKASPPVHNLTVEHRVQSHAQLQGVTQTRARALREPHGDLRVLALDRCWTEKKTTEERRYQTGNSHAYRTLMTAEQTRKREVK